MLALLGMKHGYDNLPRSYHQVHSAAHSGNHLTGDDPVGQVTLLIHFQCP